MKRYLLSILVGMSITALGASNESLESLAYQSGIASRINSESCDTIVVVDGYRVKITKSNGAFIHIGLNLFSPEMKEGLDRKQLNFIESALFAKSQKVDMDNSELLTITSGRINDFRNLSPDSACNVSHIDSRRMTAEWIIDGKEVAVSLPTNYDVIKAGSRSNIEQDFIDTVKEGGLKRASFDEINMEYLEPYGENLYIIPGGSYINRNINRNTYFSDRNLMTPVWSPDYPLESFANLVLYPSEIYVDPEVDVTVVRHEYGDKETFTAQLSQLLATAEGEGCMTFWGIEKYEDGILEGSIFTYNRHQGYDHVMKITCDPATVVNGEGTLKARVNLFIPTNNVKDMFVPYIKKTEDNKIKYDKN